MKRGDKVRFLSEVGGGKIAGFQGRDIVFVEDEDGFQIPTPITEVVVVEEDNYDKKENTTVPTKNIVDDDADYDPADRPISFKPQVEERRGGDKLSVYLAFIPANVEDLAHTKFETYIVNDTNYYINYSYLSLGQESWKLRSIGTVEPNTKLFIEEFDKDILNELDKVSIQFISYKKEKEFLLKPVADVQLKIDTVKFYKLHTFQENDYFEQPALIYPIIENDKLLKPLFVNVDTLRKELNKKQEIQPQKNLYHPIKKEDKNNPLVVDLHADEILETTAGMSSIDILNYQLDVFRKVLEENKNKHNKRIVFIHGKGNGVLRQAIIHELNYKYKKFSYQDASFQEYGYGATLVLIK